MIDREKTSLGIREMLMRDTWRDIDANRSRYQHILNDALALLKEQEAVEPKTEPSAKGYWYTCGACGWWLFEVRDTVHFDDRKRIRYCASCGRSVKWE